MIDIDTYNRTNGEIIIGKMDESLIPSTDCSSDEHENRTWFALVARVLLLGAIASWMIFF